MKNTAATVAALIVFNGLGLSPVSVSPILRLRLAGPAVSPRFTQCERYLSRFFDSGALAIEYAPLEILDGTMAVSAWLRGAVGTLQYSLKQDGISVPEPHDVDPAFWFNDLLPLAVQYAEAAGLNSHNLVAPLASRVEQVWNPDAAPDTRRADLTALYGQARYMQERDQFLTSASSIIRARVSRPLPPGQKLAFPVE